MEKRKTGQQTGGHLGTAELITNKCGRINPVDGGTQCVTKFWSQQKETFCILLCFAMFLLAACRGGCDDVSISACSSNAQELFVA